MRKRLGILLLILSTLAIGTAYAAPGSPQELLKSYVTELQTHPDDNELRIKIIRLVATMKPPPTVPEEVQNKMAGGVAAFMLATDPSGYEAAIKDFKAAVTLAPWLANGYLSLGRAQEKAGRLKEASDSLKLYLIAAPLSKVADDITTKVAELEEREAQKAKSVVAKVVEVTKHEGEEVELKAFQQKLYGGVWTYELSPTALLQIEFQGDGKLVEYISDSRTGIRHVQRNDFVLQGREAHKKSPDGIFEWTITITPDASTLTEERVVTSGGQTSKSAEVFKRK